MVNMGQLVETMHFSKQLIEEGIRYLIDTQGPDGSWDDPLWNGTGFPRVFYLKYHLYAKYFPLWALGVYRSATETAPRPGEPAATGAVPTVDLGAAPRPR